MPDRELLLERLERLAIVLDELMPRWAESVRDALSLIKELNKTIDNLLSQIGKQAGMLEDRNSTEQKSMENVIHLYDNYYVGTCPSCGKAFSTNGGTAIFCKYCGQAVKWE